MIEMLTIKSEKLDPTRREVSTKKKIITFDLNDTLIKEQGRIAYFQRQNCLWVEKENGQSENASKEYTKKLLEGIKNGEISITILPDTIRTLQELVVIGFEIWVYSTNQDEAIFFVLEKTGLNRYVTKVFSSISMGYGPVKKKESFMRIFLPTIHQLQQVNPREVYVGYCDDNLTYIRECSQANECFNQKGAKIHLFWITPKDEQATDRERENQSEITTITSISELLKNLNEEQ